MVQIVDRDGPRTRRVVVDHLHPNPHGARATMAALRENFDLTPTVGVVAMMADKAVDEVLSIFAEHMDRIIVTKVSSTDRGMAVEELAARAIGAFGAERVSQAPNVTAAMDMAMEFADLAGTGGGVVVAGSVILAGEVRAMFKGPGASRAEEADEEYIPVSRRMDDEEDEW